MYVCMCVCMYSVYVYMYVCTVCMYVDMYVLCTVCTECVYVCMCALYAAQQGFDPSDQMICAYKLNPFPDPDVCLIT